MSSSHDPFDFSRYTGPNESSTGGTSSPQRPEWETTGFTFGDADAQWEPELATSFDAAEPPLGFVFAAAALGTLGLAAVLLLGDRLGVAIVAWAVSGPAAIGLLALFTLRDTAARAHPVYTAPSWARAAYTTAFVLSLLGVLASALRIADWAGRSDLFS